ncbi:hypothetical protein BR93DRAFT_930270 [Coniochaeta sp. PMI_546]|nr:hypothetical protein BR93DRAFT_930270 [Coniochaeta sp. PMI_546]
MAGFWSFGVRRMGFMVFDRLPCLSCATEHALPFVSIMSLALQLIISISHVSYQQLPRRLSSAWNRAIAYLLLLPAAMLIMYELS